MMVFSNDAKVAEQQMHAVIFYLTTFGYIDGDFDLSEKAFIRDHIKRLVEVRVDGAKKGLDPKLRAEMVGKYSRHFNEVFDQIDHQVRELFTEAVSENENQAAFVRAKLKLRCYEIFKGFNEDNQVNILATVDEFIQADGRVHEAESLFRRELGELLHTEVRVDDADDAGVSLVAIAEPAKLEPRLPNHPFFERFERHYSADKEIIARQAAADLDLINQHMAKLDEQRTAGIGRLLGKHAAADFAPGTQLLDEHVYVINPKPGQRYELLVLGDLHGCYSCLKAALLQHDFFNKVQAFKKDPQSNPDVKVVLLGDYIDRGRFSYNGVLRTVMQLFVNVPEHVIALRGNHEYYLELNGRVYGGVRPAEAINTLVGYMPDEMFSNYMKLFDALPNMLIFDKTLFVHAGIPRDELINTKLRDLASLNDPEIRFQMLWSDPSEADLIPAELQAANARFPFGRLQFKSFMSKIGCNLMLRGHEKIEEGFKTVYDDGHHVLLNLFSAGGKGNDDLPEDSNYRSVRPMAAVLHHLDGETKVVPFEIDYARYNDPDTNKFFASPAEIEHRG
ncbi:MAG: serine/threonine protein phosphatase [Deltaproteobacteria bacterium]|nr:serine/threonine protein phosphatase [Deltaproteobacteria bacterium]